MTSYLSDFYIGVLNSQFIARMVTLPYPHQPNFVIQDLNNNEVTEAEVLQDQDSAERLMNKLKSFV